MKTLFRILFWIVIIGLGVPVFGVLVTLVLSSFTDLGSSGREVSEAASLDDVSSVLSPPSDLADALSFLSDLTEVQKDAIKDKYRGKLVQWTLPVWEVSQRDKKFVVQTSSDAPISAFCNIGVESIPDSTRMARLSAGDRITCKGIVAGYTLGFVNLSPAKLVE